MSTILQPTAAFQTVRHLSTEIREGRLVIDKRLAERILDEANYLEQRAVNKQHVASFMALMRKNAFLAGSQISFAILGNELHLLNGQHRLIAVIDSNMPQEFQVLILPAKNAEELKTLYGRHDVLMRPRSPNDILRSTGIAGREGVTERLLSSVWRSAALIAQGLRMLKAKEYAPNDVRIVEFRINFLDAFWDQARAWQEIISLAHPNLRKKLLLPPVTAIALVTLRDQHEKAKAFWTRVAVNSGLDRKEAESLLIGSVMGTISRREYGSVMAHCASAWNARWNGRDIAQLRVPQSGIVRLLGTRYDGSVNDPRRL